MFCRFKEMCYLCIAFGALAHLVERNTGSVEVSGSSPLCSTTTSKNNECWNH